MPPGTLDRANLADKTQRTLEYLLLRDSRQIDSKRAGQDVLPTPLTYSNLDIAGSDHHQRGVLLALAWVYRLQRTLYLAECRPSNGTCARG